MEGELMTEPRYGDYCGFCLRNPCRCVQNFNELPKGDLDELMKNFENQEPMTRKDIEDFYSAYKQRNCGCEDCGCKREIS